MDISLSGIWTNSYNFIRAKFTEGLSPLEKKVALLVVAYFALAALAFVCYGCFCKKATTGEITDPKGSAKSSEPTSLDEEPDSVARSGETDSPLTSEKIAITNVDQLRTLLNRFKGTINPSGEWRDIYLDSSGHVRGVGGPDRSEPFWLDDESEGKEADFTVRINMYKHDTPIKDRPFFQWNPERYQTGFSSTHFDIFDTMMDELNILAKGAYHIALQKDPTRASSSWVAIFANPEKYSYATLLEKAVASEGKALQAAQATDDPEATELEKEEIEEAPALVAPIAAPAKKKKTVPERIQDNREDAIAQQKKQEPKGFKLVDGDIPTEIYHNSIESKAVVIGGIWDVGIATCQGRRPEMEDADYAGSVTLKLNDQDYMINAFGVFDGHAGPRASAFVKENLMTYLTQELQRKCVAGVTDDAIFFALKDCCIKLDADYQGSDGTTAAIVVLLNDKLWVANVGDSRVILVKKDGTVIQASEDAKPGDEYYKRKIEEKGGEVSRVFGAFRVNGSLAVARAIGDKEAIGSKGTCLISPNPKITCYAVDEWDYFLISCDGLPDVATTDEIGNGLIKVFYDDVDYIAKRFVYSAIKNGSGDNVSVIVVKK